MELVKDLTAEIIKKHLELQHKQLGTLELAISIGEMLTSQKEEAEHGGFSGWVQENLPFSIRTAQKYMSVFSKKDMFHELGPNGLNEAYLLISPVKEEDQDVHVHKNPVHGEEDGMVDVTPEEATPEPHLQTSFHDYWDHLGPLVSKMLAVSDRLVGMRGSTTPDALGHMFGNIRDMANVLNTWNPDEIGECPMCNGKGCPVCLDGQIGMYKESQF
jgi:hypothetical protein